MDQANPSLRLLVADDDANFLKVLQYQLKDVAAEVVAVASGDAALAEFRRRPFDLILSDVRMPGLGGLELLAAVRAENALLPFIIITAHGDVDMAVEAMQAGASDFLTKPFERGRLRQKIERAARLRQLERENEALREELIDRHSFENLIGNSPAMRLLYEQMARLALRDTTVLLLGESGTGKERVARALHYAGRGRADHVQAGRGQAAGGRARHFVAINCAAIPPALLESELFGHVKGAFTGADQAREGRFQQASGGTLLLDEIGDMPPPLQAKLLRVLQEREVEPVGASRPVPVDVRIVAATHQDLARLVAAGEFREDLYYRLNVVPLLVPPLRDRLEDIPLLVRHFLEQRGAAELEIEPEVYDRLRSHRWPGNVRELENAVERALALRLHPERLTAQDFALPPGAPGAAPGNEAMAPDALFEIPESGVVLDDVEKNFIISALRRTGDNQTRAAELLGITRQKLIYRMHKYGLARDAET